MKELVASISIILNPWIGLTQNLIPNPSFEDDSKITTRWSGTFSAFNRQIKYWDSPTQGSPDILHVNSLDKMFPKRPKVSLKEHSPRTGKFMIGIKAFGCAANIMHCKEYLQIKLLQPLEKGKKYAFEYWINPISTSIKINNFGFAVSNSRIKEYSVSGLLHIYPNFVNEKIIDSKPNDWQRISGVFEADDAFKYVIVGNFSPDDSIQTKFEKGGLDYAYYLLDDVSLKSLYPKKKEKNYEIGQTLVLRNISFDFDKSELLPSSYLELLELVQILKEKSGIFIEIRGHTDKVGEEDYNLELSQKRADEVRKFLIQNGIEKERITALGYGNKYPILDNGTEENRKINRRVEIKIDSQ